MVTQMQLKCIHTYDLTPSIFQNKNFLSAIILTQMVSEKRVQVTMW